MCQHLLWPAWGENRRGLTGKGSPPPGLHTQALSTRVCVGEELTVTASPSQRGLSALLLATGPPPARNTCPRLSPIFLLICGSSLHIKPGREKQQPQPGDLQGREGSWPQQREGQACISKWSDNPCPSPSSILPAAGREEGDEKAPPIGWACVRAGQTQRVIFNLHGGIYTVRD